MLEEIRYRRWHGPPPSWIFYSALVVAEVTVLSVSKNVWLRISFGFALALQIFLMIGAKIGKMIPQGWMYLYHLIKVILYIIIISGQYSKISDRNRAIIFLCIYTIIPLYNFMVKLFRFRSIKTYFVKTQPIIPLTTERHKLINPPPINPNSIRVGSFPLAGNVIPSAPDLEDVPLEPTNKFKQEECVICLEQFEEEPADAKLECGHLFHKWCIREWLVRDDSCPLCRS